MSISYYCGSKDKAEAFSLELNRYKVKNEVFIRGKNGSTDLYSVRALDIQSTIIPDSLYCKTV